jgi:hypothetical protein
MNEPIIVNLALSAEQVDAIARRVALVVANEVVLALRSSGPTPPASPTSTPSTTDRRPPAAGRTAQSAAGRTDRGDISDAQLRALKGWRNVAQLEAVLAIVIGDRFADLETLTRREASAILTELTPANRRRANATGGGR